MRILATLVCLVWMANDASAQKLPPVLLSPEQSLCDSSAWQLVFSDDFDGPELDRTKWHSYNVYPGQETEYWEEGRYNTWTNCIWKDENVVVSDGTCKLIVKQETATWKGCETCTEVTRNYTGGILETYYTNAFHSGRFEARIKMPVFEYAHCAFWLWHGDSVNEIDIAEAYGNPYWPFFPLRSGNNRYCNYSLHSWPPKHNPYNLGHHEIRNHYPRQRWIDRLRGRYFRQDEWHVYACEWDSTQVSFFLDGQLVNTIRKYHQDGKEAECSGNTGAWEVLQGFPYNSRSGCNLRFNTAISKDRSHRSPGFKVLGQMEIDYVRVRQRRPASS